MTDILLPNVRKIFIPDPGYTIADVDLSGADAQVVAWDAGDADLKSAFRRGEKIHIKNALDMWGVSDPKTRIYDLGPGRKSYYDVAKNSVHGVNYLEGIDTLASHLGARELARAFKAKWFRLHPKIPEWHDRIRDLLAFGFKGRITGREKEVEVDGRTVFNIYGYQCPFFDRMEHLLPKAVAWVPQSTVALACFKGLIRVHKSLPAVHVLLQVHDSGVIQYPTLREDYYLPKIKEQLHTVTPYPDPLIIPWEIKRSRKSWGDCEQIEW